MKKKKIPMKKNTLIIIVAVVVFGLFAFYYFNNMNKKGNIVYYEAANTNNDLTEAQAKVIIDEKVKAIMDLYEKPLETFDVVKTENDMSFDNLINGKELSELDYYYKVSNYTDVVKELYTENGVKELESAKFGDKTFIKRDQNDVYVLKNLPVSNKYLGSNLAYYGIKFNNQIIVGGIRITKYEMVDDVINYYIVDKTIKIVKIDDKWYVESFVYEDN
jgi:hypothetical protein